MYWFLSSETEQLGFDTGLFWVGTVRLFLVALYYIHVERLSRSSLRKLVWPTCRLVVVADLKVGHCKKLDGSVAPKQERAGKEGQKIYHLAEFTEYMLRIKL